MVTVHRSDIWAAPILLRDYLRTHLADCDWYAQVKRDSAARYRNDLDGCHEGKGECLAALMERAKAWQST